MSCLVLTCDQLQRRVVKLLEEPVPVGVECNRRGRSSQSSIRPEPSRRREGESDVGAVVAAVTTRSRGTALEVEG